MKKIVRLLIIILSFVFLGCITSCSNTNPKLLEFYIEQNNESNPSNETNVSSVYNDDFEHDIEDLIDLKPNSSVNDCYYMDNVEEFTVVIKLHNPKKYDITSLTINDVEYQRYSFERGSNTQIIYLKITPMKKYGYQNFTLKNIKYKTSKDEETKFVDLGSINTMVTIGVKRNIEPQADLIRQTVEQSNATIFFRFDDPQYAVNEETLKIFLSDGKKIVDEKPISYGDNTIVFDKLTYNSEYQYAIKVLYDMADGKNEQIKTLLKGSFKTLAKVNIFDLEIKEEEISFKIDENPSYQITKVALFDGDKEIAQITDFNNLSFTGLLSNHDYQIVLSYTNGNKIENVYYNVKTLAKKTPSLTLSNTVITGSYIKANIIKDDPFNLATINKVSLFKDGEFIRENTYLKVNFSDLNYFTNYEIKIEFSYDLNDGRGKVNALFSYVFVTDPNVKIESFIVLNKQPIPLGETIIIEINLNDLKYEPKSAVINGMEYPVSLNENNTYVITIMNAGQFSGGESTLIIEQLNGKYLQSDYIIELETNNEIELTFDNGMTIERIEFVDQNYNPIDYAFPNTKIYVELTLNNPSNYEIILINDRIGGLIKVDNEHYVFEYTIDNTVSWQSFNLKKITFRNNDVVSSVEVKEDITYYQLLSNEIKYITTYQDLLSMNEGYYYELKNDISLKDIIWEGAAFNGVFNGQGHSITGMNISNTYSNILANVGLFSVGNGVITNLKMNEITGDITINDTGIGASFNFGSLIANSNDNLIIDNVEVESQSAISIKDIGTINYNTKNIGGFVGISLGDYVVIKESINKIKINGKDNIGGFIGEADTTKIINSINYGEIIGDKYVGGFIGQASSTIVRYSCNLGNVKGVRYIGGFVGYGESITVLSSYNNAEIEGSMEVGGFIGETSKLISIKSYNQGLIYAYSEQGYYLTNIGGLAGYADNFQISYSFNMGIVDAYDGDNVGGLFGKGDYGIIMNSYNIADIKCNYSQYSVGGLAGYASEITIANAYNAGTIFAGSSSGGLVGEVYFKAIIMNAFNSGEVKGKLDSGSIIGNFRYDTMFMLSNIYSLEDTYIGYPQLNGLPCTKADLNNKDFYLKKLGWFENVWDFNNLDFDNGHFPKLK